MSLLGDWSVDAVVEAAGKCIAKLNDAEVARVLTARARMMDQRAYRDLLEAVFDAFRERGESSEDASEGAATTIAELQDGEDRSSIAALLNYARQSPGLLRDALTLLVERHPATVGDLPPELVASISRRLAGRT